MSLRKFISFGFVLGTLFALGSATLPAVHAASTILVNDPGDTTGPCSTTGTGTCTLRDAITFANASAGGDTIHFDISGTITLGAPLPAIQETPSSSLTID